MSEVRVNNLSNENNTGGPTISGITTYSGRHFFVPPQGDTASRPSDCEPGSLRFNTDSAHLEYFRGNDIGWVEIEASDNRLGGGTGSNEGVGFRGFIFGGNTVSPFVYVNNIDFITISTFGNSQDFGDMATGKRGTQCIANDVRVLFPGGYNGLGYTNDISFNIVSSTGNGSDFGDLTVARSSNGTVNNKTRGIIGSGQDSGGSPYYTNTIDYVTIAQTGNAVDFGDNTTETLSNGCSSSTRGLFGQDNNTPTDVVFVTMSTLGNTQDFGDVDGHRSGGAGASSATRCLLTGNYFGNNMSYMTMATLGDSIDFGDLDVSRDDPKGMSSSTRAVIGLGRTIPTYRVISSMSSVEIATTGNAVDFGDITYLGDGSNYQRLTGGGSNGHGGLSG